MYSVAGFQLTLGSGLILRMVLTRLYNNWPVEEVNAERARGWFGDPRRQQRNQGKML